MRISCGPLRRPPRSRWPFCRSRATNGVLAGAFVAYVLTLVSALGAQTGSGVQPSGGTPAGTAQLTALTNTFVSPVTTETGGLVVTGTGVTTGVVASITGSSATPGADNTSTGLVRGSALNISGNIGSSSTNTAVRSSQVNLATTINTATAGAFNANLRLGTTMSGSGSASNAIGLYSVTSDITTLAHSMWGIDSFSTTSAGDAAKTLTAVRGRTTAAGAVTAGTQTLYGVQGTASSTNLAGGTTNVYAGHFQGGGSVASGTINSYGLYVANALAMTATGTSQNVGLFVEPPTGADTNIAVLVDTGGRTRLLGPLEIGTALTFSPTAPTVTSAGTSPSVVANGTAAFRVNVGTGGTATTIVMAMPAATTGWNCFAENITGAAANRANQRVVLQSSTTTAVTVQNQTISTGAALAFTASDIVAFLCAAY